MFFRSSRVYLAKVFPGCQSSGVCVADVQFAAVVLATNPTAGIQSAHHGSSLGAAAADDERDPDLLSGLCGPVSSTRISRVVADAEGRGAPKNPGPDATTSSRSIASARPRPGSLDSLRIQKCALENLSRPRQGYTFLLPCKSFALVTREIRAASLSLPPRISFSLIKPFARPARSPVRFCHPICLNCRIQVSFAHSNLLFVLNSAQEIEYANWNGFCSLCLV